METRAPYASIELFLLAAIGAVFGFVYWLNNTGGLSKLPEPAATLMFDTQKILVQPSGAEGPTFADAPRPPTIRSTPAMIPSSDRNCARAVRAEVLSIVLSECLLIERRFGNSDLLDAPRCLFSSLRTICAR